MEKRAFGNTGMQVSVLGFGGAEIGFEEASQKTVEDLLNSALDQGLNVIDTAECYLGSEVLIGQAVSKRRQDFYLFTKCGHRGTYDVPAWDAQSIEASIDQSLTRLKTDYLDLVQLHSCSEETLRRGECIESLVKAKKSGKTRFIGYSGDGDAARYAIGTGIFDSLQTSVNIADQQCIDQVLPLAVEAGMGIIAKRPIANVAWRTKDASPSPYAEPYWQRLRELSFDFINGNLADSAEMALRFTLSVPGVSTAIVGTAKPSRWKQNAEVVAKGPLSAVQYEAIRGRWRQVAQPDWVGQV